TFLSDGQREGWEPAVWFAVTLPRNRAIGLTVLLENGACYRELPSQAWAFAPEAPAWTMQEAQAWDCFGGAAQMLPYDYLLELSVRTQHGAGTYLFTLEFGDNGFSRYPAQSKCLHAIELDSGRLTWQPNNCLTFTEASFTSPGDTSWLRRQTRAWHAEP
ncbi:MAG: hypothetical protein VW405_16810, partial [Rhodospirillaceae bacterium]